MEVKKKENGAVIRFQIKQSNHMKIVNIHLTEDECIVLSFIFKKMVINKLDHLELKCVIEEYFNGLNNNPGCVYMGLINIIDNVFNLTTPYEKFNKIGKLDFEQSSKLSTIAKSYKNYPYFRFLETLPAVGEDLVQVVQDKFHMNEVESQQLIKKWLEVNKFE